jgi:hypothetical protein
VFGRASPVPDRGGEVSKQTARKPTPHQIRVLRTLTKQVGRPSGLPHVEQEIAVDAGGAFFNWHGSGWRGPLLRSVRALERAGYVRCVKREFDHDIYRITEAGRAIAAEEAAP